MSRQPSGRLGGLVYTRSGDQGTVWRLAEVAGGGGGVARPETVLAAVWWTGMLAALLARCQLQILRRTEAVPGVLATIVSIMLAL